MTLTAKRLFTTIIAFATLSLYGQQAESVKGCYALRSGDTLRIGNDLIERIFLWKGGNVATFSIENKASKDIWHSKPVSSDFYVPDLTYVAKNGTFEVRRVASDGVTVEHLEAEVTFLLDSLWVKRIYRVYADSPVLACDTYLKGSAEGLSRFEAINLGDMKNIESNKAEKKKVTYPLLDRLALDGVHWEVDAVEFFDVTDRNNTLVSQVKGLGYKGNQYRGNILFMHDKVKSAGLFFLKESPVSTIQMAYPGADFSVTFGRVNVMGMGVADSDLSHDQWTRAYSCVVGMYAGGELERLTQLQSYRKLERALRSSEDEMVMANTWGDRGQDRKVNEAFCLEEIRLGARLGITHFQIDDGWQVGKSGNSAFGGSFKNIWGNPDYWNPDPVKYPRGLTPLVEECKKSGIELGLWFNPSSENRFADWSKDASALIRLYKQYGIKVFKIDGVTVADKLAENRLRMMFDRVMDSTQNNVIFNIDVTASRRGGYFYMTEYGNIFLENRYTDWGNYFPHWTLRNVWMLSRYIPTQKIQVEFLNNWRNRQKYAPSPYNPEHYSFEYLFATTMAGQPLVWMELSSLPEEAFAISKRIEEYKKIQHDFHSGTILPIGDEPSGESWTGFQSIKDDCGYLLLYRENNPEKSHSFQLFVKPLTTLELRPVFVGKGKTHRVKADKNGMIDFTIDNARDFVMYSYKTE